jgi:methylthioribose-1-phosphate isomerase
MAGSLEAVRYKHAPGGVASLKLLEQRKLPLETEWLDIAGPKEAWMAIRDMTVRGAPAIGGCPPPPPGTSPPPAASQLALSTPL